MSDDGWTDVDTSEYEDLPAREDSGDDDGWTDVPAPSAKIVDDVEPADDGPGWWDSTIAAVQRGLDDFNSGIGEVSQTLGRFAKENINDSVGNDLEDFGSFLKRGAESWRPSTDAVLNAIPENSWQKTSANVTQGLANAFPSLLTGGGNLLRTVALNAISRFGQTEGDIERELRAKGVEDEDAIIEQKESGAGLSTALNAPLDAIFMAPMFNQATRPLRKTVESAIGGGLQALPAKWADLLGRYQGGVTDQAPGIDEVLDNAGNNILEGTIQGGAMGAAMAGAQATGDYFSNKSSRAKQADWDAKLDANVRAKAEAAELAALNAAESGVAPEVPIPASGAMGDEHILPSLPPEMSAAPRDFTPEDTGRAPTEFDQQAAKQYAENQALTKMGVTEKIPEPPQMKTKTTTKMEETPLVEGGESTRITSTVPDPKSSMKPVDEGALDKFPVVEYDLSRIEDLPEVPNMKRKATGKGGTVPGKELKSENYQRLPKNPITLLEMEDGRIGIVTGRHRRRLADDLGEKTIPAQLVRERDGYTTEWARMFDAEQNIRDGQGEVDDYANYFRQAKLSPEEADKRGLLRNSTGKDGFEIGTNGSKDVFDRYMNSNLTREEAVAIVRAAPKNDEGQTAGVMLVKGGTKLNQLHNAVQDYLELQASGAIPKEAGPEQTGLPGFEDTSKVMRVIVAKANAADAIIRDIDADIYSNRGAAKNPDKAAKGGTQVKDVEATKAYIKEKEALKARWKNWKNDPELSKQLNDQFTTKEIVSDPIVAEEKFDIVPDQQTGLFQIDNSADVFPVSVKKPFSEEPSAEIINTKESAKNVSGTPLSDQALNSKIKSRLLDEKGAVRADIPNPFTTDGFKDFISRLRGKGIQKNPEIYNFFNSKRNLLASEISKADKFPQYRRNHEAALKMFEMENSIAWDHDAMLRPFTLLNAKEKQNVSTLLYAGLRKGKDFDSSPENLKALGLSDREVRGVQSVRRTMDSALESMRQLAKDKVAKSTLSEDNKLEKMWQIDQAFNGMKESNFVPTGRYGKYGLTLYDTNGKVVSFIMNDSKAKLANTLYEAIRKDPTIDPKLSRVAPVAKALGSEYVGAHPDIMEIMEDSGAHIPNASFENRFKKRDFIEGFEADLQRNIASYLASHARYLSSQKTKQKFAELNKQFDAFYETLGSRDKALYSGLRGNIDQLQKFVMKPSNDMLGTSKAFATFYLANAVKTSLVNTTSFITSSYPKIAKYTTGLKNLTLTPERIFAQSIADTAQYYGRKAMGKTGGKVGQDLWASLEAARREGVVGGNRVMKDLLTNANRPTAMNRFSSAGQKVSMGDIAFFLNGTTEDFVRTNAYITGWHTYPHAKGFFEKQSARNAAQNEGVKFDPNIKLPDRHTFAKNFVRETQADYTKAGIPDIAKNPVGKLGSTFRLFHHAFITSVKRSAMEVQLGALTRYAAAVGALGGVYATPIAGSILMGLKSAGVDVDYALKKGLEFFGMTSPRAQQMALNGLPTHPITNVNVRSALSPDLIPQSLAQGDIIGGLGRAFAGVLVDPIDRVDRAWFYYKEKGDVPRALEQLLPSAFNLQALARAARYKREGVRNSNGVDILGRPPTDEELRRVRLGFQPATISAAQDRDLALGRIKSKLDNEGINQKIAKAEVAGDDKTVDELMKYAEEKGLKIDPKAIMEQIRRIEDRDYALTSKVGGKAGLEYVPEIEAQYEELVNPK